MFSFTISAVVSDIYSKPFLSQPSLVLLLYWNLLRTSIQQSPYCPSCGLPPSQRPTLLHVNRMQWLAKVKETKKQGAYINETLDFLRILCVRVPD